MNGIEAGRRERRAKMLGGGVMGAEPRVEKTQFLLRPREIGVEHQQAFERADRRLVIPQFGREQDVAIGRVVIRRKLANVIGEPRLLGERILRPGRRGERHGGDENSRRRKIERLRSNAAL